MPRTSQQATVICMMWSASAFSCISFRSVCLVADSVQVCLQVLMRPGWLPSSLSCKRWAEEREGKKDILNCNQGKSAQIYDSWCVSLGLHLNSVRHLGAVALLREAQMFVGMELGHGSLLRKISYLTYQVKQGSNQQQYWFPLIQGHLTDDVPVAKTLEPSHPRSWWCID